MADRETATIAVGDLRRKISWLFYGTRTYANLDTTDKAIVDEIMQDGYEKFLYPPPLPNEEDSHQWEFLRPTLTLPIKEGVTDYQMSPDFGGFEGKLYYEAGLGKRWPLEKTFVDRIDGWLQRNSSTYTSYPTHYALYAPEPDSGSPQTTMIKIYPSPDGDYTVRGRYYIHVPPLDSNNPYPVGEPFHNKCIEEACLAAAEERLEDNQSLHAGLFLERLRASVSRDRDKYGADKLGVDRDRSDDLHFATDYRSQGDYVRYTGHTHSWE